MALIAYEVGSLLAMLGWLLLLVGGLASAAKRATLSIILDKALWLGGRVIPLLLSLAYLVLMIGYWNSSPDGNFGSLEGIRALFQIDGNLAGAWLHFLAFDLLIGRWIVDDVNNKRSLRWTLLICLPMTFMYGPTGLLVYLAITWCHKKLAGQRQLTA